jgi:hypothetical protein
VKFTLTIETNMDHKPADRREESTEIYRLRDVLVLVTSALTSRGLHSGEVTAVPGAAAEYQYKLQRKPAAARLPPAA